MTGDRSALAPFADRFAEATRSSAGRVEITDVFGWGALNVRVDPTDAAPLAAALGTELPTRPDTITEGAPGLVLGLGPDEWLVLLPNGVDDLADRLRVAAGDAPVSVVDVSAGRSVLGLRGPAARRVLAHGCALDLDARTFAPGACAQTRLALADVVLVAPPGQAPDEFAAAPRFLILVRPSFAAYLAGWLLDAATEYLTDADPLSPGL